MVSYNVSSSMLRPHLTHVELSFLMGTDSGPRDGQETRKLNVGRHIRFAPRSNNASRCGSQAATTSHVQRRACCRANLSATLLPATGRSRGRWRGQVAVALRHKDCGIDCGCCGHITREIHLSKIKHITQLPVPSVLLTYPSRGIIENDRTRDTE